MLISSHIKFRKWMDLSKYKKKYYGQIKQVVFIQRKLDLENVIT